MRVIQYLAVALLVVGGIFIGLFFYKKYSSQQVDTPKNVALKDASDATLNETETEAALKVIERVDPSEMSNFPTDLTYMMKREGCKIPRIPKSKNQGWIQGSFADSKQKDYAALCITPQNEMTIKVFWGGKNRPCPISLAYGMATKYVVYSQKNELEFARILLLAPKNRLAYFAKDVPQTIIKNSIDGIEDALFEKRSIIYFCTNGSWQSIPTNYPN